MCPKAGNGELQAPEKLHYSRYYEHDGALRAYANRAMVLAFLCVPTVLLAVGLAIYVRLQPPTVIRVDSNGTATILGGKSSAAKEQERSISVAVGSEPNDFEKKAYVELFLRRYLNFSYDSIDRNWADALNMMTSNLRRATLSTIQKDNIIGKVQDDQITSVFHLRTLEVEKDDPLSFTAFGVKEVHRVRDHQEANDKLVGEFHVRLIRERRSDQNPNGLLIAEYTEKLIDGERRDALTREMSFNKPN